MARYVVPILLFFLPFVLYAVYLWLTNRNPADKDHWTTKGLVLLTLAGLFVAVVMFGLAGAFTGQQISGRNAEGIQADTPPTPATPPAPAPSR
jgi:uncharacterized membrane protein YiaA